MKFLAAAVPASGESQFIYPTASLASRSSGPRRCGSSLAGLRVRPPRHVVDGVDLSGVFSPPRAAASSTIGCDSCNLRAGASRRGCPRYPCVRVAAGYCQRLPGRAIRSRSAALALPCGCQLGDVVELRRRTLTGSPPPESARTMHDRLFRSALVPRGTGRAGAGRRGRRFPPTSRPHPFREQARPARIARQSVTGPGEYGCGTAQQVCP